MKNLADITLNQLAAHRANAALAARPTATSAQQAAVLAKDLMNALDANDEPTARRLALALRPLLGLLPEGN